MRLGAVRGARALSLAVAVGLVSLGCGSRRAAAPRGDAAVQQDSAAPAVGEELPPNAIDLTEAFRQGGIDVAGPVVDLGEPQASAYLSAGTVLRAETLNGDSWASVAGRVRLRVPLESRSLSDLSGEPLPAPDTVRLRVRHATARSVAVVVDGLLVRVAALAPYAQSTVVSASVPADRFTRAMADVELRFPRAPKTGPSAAPSAEVDWVHLTRGATPVTRVVDLLNDVAVERTPRRALTFYPPTTLSAFEVIPRGAVFRASLAAEAPRGAARAPRPLTARVRVEADGVPSLERRVVVQPNQPWVGVELDLGSLAGRPARFSVSALSPAPSPDDAQAELPDGGVEAPRSEVRLALSSPRIELRDQGHRGEGAPTQIKRVVWVIVRGARADRFVPTLSPHLNAGGFAALQQRGVALEAASPASRNFAALTSVSTGLASDLHRVTESTERLADDAPRALASLVELGIPVEAWADDRAWASSGAARGANFHPCPDEAESCTPEALFGPATEGLLASRGRYVSVLVLRSGLLPLSPANEDIHALDPTPYEGTMTPGQTAVLLTRVRRGEVRIDARDQERLGLLYDAALRGVDRALATMIERLREARMLDETLFVVSGDRGTALGEARVIQDGALTLRASGSTVLIASGPGLDPRALAASLVTGLDGAATLLDVFGVERVPDWDGRSLFRPLTLNDRAVPVTLNTRGDTGLRFGELLALPRPAAAGGGVALLVPADDPLGQRDVSDARPIARLFAELALARVRGAEGRRGYTPVRVPVEAPTQGPARPNPTR
ncbi:MAG: hypothetical protein JNK72_22405 [Myxococcales bacterium]|nr:hypothetical protein [Myxococcales bacterium]